MEVVETDLGEYIIQMEGETPSHIIVPAIHKNRRQVGRLFADRLGAPYSDDPPVLTKIARKALRDVIETYLRRGGFEMQINVVGKDTLLDAQEHPEQYQDLLVRVAGYSDYFVHLNRKMQDEVIARTEHEL